MAAGGHLCVNTAWLASAFPPPLVSLNRTRARLQPVKTQNETGSHKDTAQHPVPYKYTTRHYSFTGPLYHIDSRAGPHSSTHSHIGTVNPRSYLVCVLIRDRARRAKRVVYLSGTHLGSVRCPDRDSVRDCALLRRRVLSRTGWLL